MSNNWWNQHKFILVYLIKTGEKRFCCCCYFLWQRDQLCWIASKSTVQMQMKFYEISFKCLTLQSKTAVINPIEYYVFIISCKTFTIFIFFLCIKIYILRTEIAVHRTTHYTVWLILRHHCRFCRAYIHIKTIKNDHNMVFYFFFTFLITIFCMRCRAVIFYHNFFFRVLHCHIIAVGAWCRDKSLNKSKPTQKKNCQTIFLFYSFALVLHDEKPFIYIVSIMENCCCY